MVVSINILSKRRFPIPPHLPRIAYVFAVVACLSVGVWLFEDSEPAPSIPDRPILGSATPLDDRDQFPPAAWTNEPAPPISHIHPERDTNGAEPGDHKAPFRDNSGSKPERHWAHVAALNLEGADLRGKISSNGDYTNANLRGADLSGANLSGIDLRGANLRDTVWQRAVVRGQFQNAELNNADLRGSNFTFSDMRAADLRHVSAGPIEAAENELIAATFDGVDFTGADLRGSDFRLALVVGTVFRDADLRGADLRRAMFVGEAHWEGAIYDDTTMFDEGFDPLERGMIRRSVDN